MLLTRDAILKADDLKRELVSVPEWGGEVYVRTLTGAEKDAVEEGNLCREGEDVRISYTNYRARLAAAALCDDAGKALFTAKDVAVLGSKSAAALDRVLAAAKRLNAVSEADIEELAKN